MWEQPLGTGGRALCKGGTVPAHVGSVYVEVVDVYPVCRHVQVLRNHIAQELGVGLVLLPSNFANAVEAAESARIRGAPEGHHLIRYDVHGYVLRGLAGGLGQLLGQLAQQAVGHGVLADVGVDGEHRHGGGAGLRAACCARCGAVRLPLHGRAEPQRDTL